MECFFHSFLKSSKNPAYGRTTQDGMLFDVVLRQSLFIRPCYPELWEAVRAWFANRGDQPLVSVLITGTPGIGKSSFLIYAVYQVGCYVSTLLFHGDGSSKEFSYVAWGWQF